MRILIATRGAGSKLSGSNVAIKRLAVELKNRGHKLLLLGAFYENPEFWVDTELPPSSLVHVKFSGILSPPLKKLYRIMSKFSPDVVHTHDRNVDTKFSLITRLLRIPQVITIHGFLSSFTNNPLRYQPSLNSLWNSLWYQALKKSSKIIAISEAVRQDVLSILKIPPKQIVTIYNGIDTDKFRPITDDPESARSQIIPFLPSQLTLTLAGRLAMDKNPEKLIDLVSIIRGRGVECQGVYVGIGPEERALMELARLKGLESNIFFLGLRSDIENVYTCSDFLVHFQKDEGFGLAVAEAMSCERPVICVNKGALVELVDDRQTGYLLPPDKLDLWADKIIELYANKEKWKNLARNARVKAEKQFGLSDFAANYEKALKEVQLT